jgi:2-polyprenyl-3-methyl-5-hydroxy-6-metoxy-1,4-benzoquinol methylase
MEEKAGYYSKTRNEMLEFVPHTVKKVLDIGCAEGEFSLLVKKERDAEVWGIELDEAAAARAQEKIDKVLVGDIATLVEKLPNAYFDCIVCNDVLEHLVDPYAVITILKEKLSKDGVVVFSLPNVRHFGNLKNLLLRKDWRYESEGILDKTHLRFFTEKSIRRMFTELGYQLVVMRGLRPIRSWKFTVLDLATLGRLSDARYLQFAGVAKPTT